MRGASFSDTTAVPLMRRVTLLDFFSRMWRLPAFSRRILPLPVTLKRFEVPLCVLFFGISVLVSCYPPGRGRACVLFGGVAGVVTLDVAVLVLLDRTHLDVLVGRQHHDHVAAVLL